MDLSSFPTRPSLLSSSSGWRDRLQDASFRGVPFKVEEESAGTGRRVETHEYPNRDKPYTEDLGKITFRPSITAYVVGDDCFALMRELDPRTTTELINRWERLCGLPDECIPAGTQTLRQRQQRLDAKVNLAGGINEDFYLAQLAALGRPDATITRYDKSTFTCSSACTDAVNAPEWRYYWQINMPAATNTTWMTCGDPCDSALRIWGDTVVECVLNKLCPSHTYVIFKYPE